MEPTNSIIHKYKKPKTFFDRISWFETKLTLTDIMRGISALRRGTFLPQSSTQTQQWTVLVLESGFKIWPRGLQIRVQFFIFALQFLHPFGNIFERFCTHIAHDWPSYHYHYIIPPPSPPATTFAFLRLGTSGLPRSIRQVTPMFKQRLIKALTSRRQILKSFSNSSPSIEMRSGALNVPLFSSG